MQTEPKYNRFEPWDFSDLILAQAESYKHAPYARGASLQTGSATDCSGFVQFIYHGFKIDLPRSSAEQAQVGKTVTREMDFSKLLPGDLLFFCRGGHHVGHAGIYLGDGKMIHASSPRTGVTVTDLRQPILRRHLCGGQAGLRGEVPQLTTNLPAGASQPAAIDTSL